jgi:beta-glucanase (GH16 family)
VSGYARRTRLAVMAAALIAVTAGCSPAMGTSVGTVPGSSGVSAARVGWRIVFSDHFTGPAGSRAGPGWTYDTGTRYHGIGCPARWGTGEAESASTATANLRQDGHGHLLIIPVKSGGRWTSGRIETVAAGFMASAGGELQVTASIRQPAPASGLGYWPAFWMLGAGFRARGAGTSGTMNCARWPAVGEIDIMEDVNGLSQLAGTLHCGSFPGGPCYEGTGLGSGLRPCNGCQAGYHTYSVIVNRVNAGREYVTWYLDGHAYFTVTQARVEAAVWRAAVDHGFFLVLDVAIGGAFPDAGCGCTTPVASTSQGAAMSIQYVTVSVR